MSTTVILKAFLDEMVAFVAAQPSPIAYPGVNLIPPDSGMWLETLFFPGEPADPSWDNDGCINANGFFQVSVFYRPGKWQIQASELADSIISFFPKGSFIGGVRVKKKPWQSPAVTVDSSKLYIPVTIPYSGLIK